MQHDCQECMKIISFEKALDQRAEEIVERVKLEAKPITDRNNARWRKFAFFCNLPLVGNFIFKLFNTPVGLEHIPPHWNEPWYQDAGRKIYEEASILEKMKYLHMEHWGDEIVQPCDSTDPSGYYTPTQSPRRDCYAHGFTPFEPSKYDFYSAAGASKFESDELVLCSMSKQLVPLSRCDWVRSEEGIFYRDREVPHIVDHTDTPRFNEWRPSDYYNQAKGWSQQH